MMEIEKNTTANKTKWIHSQTLLKQINKISISINNLNYKITYETYII